MRILITGAGGFIGSHLADRLNADGHSVVGVDKKHVDEWIGDGCTHVLPTVDLAQWSSIASRKLFNLKVDLCYHLAAESRIQPSFADPLQCCRDNLMGTANVLALCKEWWKCRIIYAGSSTADDDIRKNVYAMTKRHGEQMCETWHQCFGLDYSIARFYNVYGPRQIEEGPDATVIGIFERQYRNGEQLTVTGSGGQRRDFTSVDDIVSGLVAIAERGGRDIYALGRGINYSILEVARMFVGDDRIKFIPQRPGEAEKTLADVERTKRLLDWEAVNTLPEYVNKWKTNPFSSVVNSGLKDVA